MTKKEIIEQIAKERVIENLMANVCKGGQQFDLDDLAQDLYLDLMKKDDEKIVRMYQENELDYFILRMLSNQFFSTTSPFFRNYIMTKAYEQLPYYDQEDTDD